MAQRVITGRVIDSTDSLPLPMTTVLLKGTTQGIATNGDGNFQLTVPSTGGVLIIRFLGYITQEVTISDKNHFEIALVGEQNDGKLIGCLCCGPADYFQIQWLSGINHTHYGVGTSLLFSSFKNPLGLGYIHPKLRVNARYQFFKDNEVKSLRLDRYDNFRIFNKYVETSLEVSKRQIQLSDNVQDIQEFSLIQSTYSRWGDFGLGASLQTERFESTTRKSLALVIEWEEYVFRAITAKVQVKRWQKATQARWNLSHYVYRANLMVSLGGIHYKTYNEISLGLAYDFNL